MYKELRAESLLAEVKESLNHTLKCSLSKYVILFQGDERTIAETIADDFCARDHTSSIICRAGVGAYATGAVILAGELESVIKSEIEKYRKLQDHPQRLKRMKLAYGLIQLKTNLK